MPFSNEKRKDSPNVISPQLKKILYSVDTYLPSNAKKLSKVMELPMNITTDCYRTSHGLQLLGKSNNLFSFFFSAIENHHKLKALQDMRMQ